MFPAGTRNLTWAHGQDVSWNPAGMNSLTNPVGDGVMKLFTLPNGQVLGYDLGGVMEYFHKDRLGSVLAMTNDAGGKEAYYRYDPYGQPRSYYRWSPTAKANTLMYVGVPRDTATGLVRMGARWYDPTQGRFTTADPSGQETHPYLYAAGNPVNNTDPSGLFNRLQTHAGSIYGLATTAVTAAAKLNPLGGAIVGGVGGLIIGAGVELMDSDATAGSVLESSLTFGFYGAVGGALVPWIAGK